MFTIYKVEFETEGPKIVGYGTNRVMTINKSMYFDTTLMRKAFIDAEGLMGYTEKNVQVVTSFEDIDELRKKEEIKGALDKLTDREKRLLGL